ncbi:MAG: hypothetical protein JHC21_05675 [Thermocrinis sp.]|nr:hypothetical protein [Thermocrinis sp.]
MKVIRWLLSFYILGYLFYHLTPVFYTVHVNYAPPKPIPLPYQKTCKVVFGVKTALDRGVGRPDSLEKALEEKGITFSLGHSIDYSQRIKRGDVPEGYGYRDLSGLSLLSYFIFSYVPELITFSEKEDIYGLLNPRDCKPILSDIPVLISTPLGELPSYSFVLGKRWNLAYPDCDSMLSFYPVVGRELSFSIYSPPKLNPPLNVPLQKVQLNLKVEGKKVLILVYKDGILSEIYDQPLLTLNLEEEGNYQLKVYSYKFKAFNFYFGLRFIGCLSEIKVKSF